MGTGPSGSPVTGTRLPMSQNLLAEPESKAGKT